MPLDANALGSAIQNVFESFPPTPHDCAVGLAQAYVDYASTGLFGASVPVLDDDRRDAMADVIEAAISNPLVGLAATFAAAWAAALTAFWIVVPVVGAQVGVTAGCPGATSLTGLLTVVLANPANTAASCASSMASAIDTATKTVTAAVVPPPGTTLPIS